MIKTSFKIKIEDIGKQFDLPTGLTPFTFTVLETMVGLQFGQFATTKKTGPVIHLKKNRKSKRK